MTDDDQADDELEGQDDAELGDDPTEVRVWRGGLQVVPVGFGGRAVMSVGEPARITTRRPMGPVATEVDWADRRLPPPVL